MTAIDQITSWSIVGIGVVGIVCGLVQTFRAKTSVSETPKARGFLPWPISVSTLLAAGAVAAVLFSRRVPKESVPEILAALIVGWALLSLLVIPSRTAGRKLAADSAGETNVSQVRAGTSLLSASGFLSCAFALLAVGIIPRFSHFMPIEALVTLVLGAWLAVTFWSLPSSLYRSALSQEAESRPAEAAPLCVQFRSASGEMAFLAGAGLAAAGVMAVYHYPGETTGSIANVSALLYPLGVFAAAVLFAILANPLIRSGLGASSARRGRFKRALAQWAGTGIFLLGTGAAAYFLAMRAVADIRAFWSLGVGLLTAVLVAGIARYRAPFARMGSQQFGTEIAIAQALMVLAAAVLAFRWLGGYGMALCGTGLLSSFAMVLPLGAMWAASTVRQPDSPEFAEEVDLPFMAHAASRFAEVSMAAVAFIAVMTLVVVFKERAGLGRAGIDITDPYPLIGLVVGASFPVILRGLLQSGRVNLSAATFDPGVLSKLGRWAAWRTLGVWFLAGIIPLVVAFFWRAQAAGAFLVGLAAAELFLILTLWLGEVRNTTDEGSRLATRSTHILAVGTALVTALLAPPLIELTGTLSRVGKIKSLAVVFAVLFVWVLVVTWRRLRSSRA